MLFGQFPVYGSEKVAAKFWSNGKIGRADFQLRNIGDNEVVVALYEADMKNENQAKLGDSATIKAGGIVTISVSTAKPVILFKSDTTNVNDSLINLDAQFIGRAFYGQLDIAENLPNEAFEGTNLNGADV